MSSRYPHAMEWDEQSTAQPYTILATRDAGKGELGRRQRRQSTLLFLPRATPVACAMPPQRR